MLASGDEVDVSTTLSPGAGKVMGEGASVGGIPRGDPADPNDTGESKLGIEKIIYLYNISTIIIILFFAQYLKNIYWYIFVCLDK